MQKKDKATFRVVGILSPTRIILNCGSDEGITFDSQFRVYAYGPEIKDFETDEILERVYLPRGIGKVVVLQRRICTIESTSRSFGATVAFTLGQTEPMPFAGVQIGDFADLIVAEKKS